MLQMQKMQSSIAFRKYQVTQYIISHACSVGTHEDATMAKDSLHCGGGCWNAVQRAHKMMYRLELLIAEDVLDSGIWWRRRQFDSGAAHSWSWKFSRPTLQDRDQDHKYQDQDLVSQDQDRVKLVSFGLVCSWDQDCGLEDYILAQLHWKTNRKSCVAYRMAPLPLNDPESHFCCLKPLTPIPRETQHECTNTVHHVVLCSSWASCSFYFNDSHN